MSIFDRVLITGGGGMLAQAIARALRVRGHDPVSLRKDQYDILDSPPLNWSGATLTLIINCAAFTKVDLCEQEESKASRINATGPSLLARHAKDAGVPLVHFSTDFVFDGTSSRPYTPRDATNPLSSYGASKLLGEELIECSGASSLIVRTSWLYGPNGPNFVQTMLNAARAGKPLKVVNDQIGSPTYTYDLADATLDLIDAGARGIYHATNSGRTSWFDFARAIFEEFDVKADLSPTTSAEWKASHPNSATRPAYSVLDCSETERVIGRKLPDWRDALHRYRLAIEHV